MDNGLVYASIIMSIGSLLSSFYLHVRHSSCCKGMIEIDTYTPTQINPPTQLNPPTQQTSLLKNKISAPIPIRIVKLASSIDAIESNT